MTTNYEQYEHATINQSNKDGDNVARDKVENIYQDIAPRSLLRPIEKILGYVKNKETEKALIQLETIKSMGSLDSDSLALLDIVSIRINIIKQPEIDGAYQTLTAFYQKEPIGLAADLCLASLIRLDVIKESFPDAKARYKQLDTPGIYTQEAYFDLLADSEHIENEYNTNRLYLTEISLCSLVRGGIREKLLDQTITMATQLNDKFPSFNSRVLLVIAKTNQLIEKLGTTHYWFITYSLKCALNSLYKEIIPLIEESHGKEERLIPTASSILIYMMGEPKDLEQLCLKYIDIVKQVSPDLAKKIWQPEKNMEHIDDSADKLFKAYSDQEYKKNLLTEITKNNNITADDVHILLRIGNSEIITNWLNNNGNISSDNQLEIDYFLLSLKAKASTTDLKATSDIETIFNDFIKKHPEYYDQMSPVAAAELAEKLFNIELFIPVIELLKPYINFQDPWPSPPIKCYINSLMDGQQNHGLNQLLNNINIDAWDHYVWQIKAKRLADEKQYPEAITAYHEALKLAPESIYLWNNTLHVHKLNKSSNEDVLKFIEKIPTSVFIYPSEQAAIFLMEWTRLSSFKKAEGILLDWFIQNPESSSILITNFYFTLLTHTDGKQIKFSTLIPNIDGAIRYLESNIVKTKIVINNNENVSSHTTLSSSPLGQALLNTPIGETVKLGIKSIKILEKMPPFHAALNICTELRETINDGNDCFHSLSLPNDPAEMYEEMKSMMLDLESDTKHITQAANIPLLMKCAKLNSTNPVQVALQAMTSDEFLKHPLPNVGIEIYDELILDVYSIVYLALTGLHKGIDYSKTCFIITEPTKLFFDNWFQDINREDYLRAGVSKNGHLFRTTADDIKKQTKDLQKAFLQLLKHTEIRTENLINLPPNILKIRGLVCYSVYSSLTLSIANDIPWLCIDGLFSQLYQLLGHTAINAANYLAYLAENTSFDDKKQGLYLHSIANLPYPLTFEELFQLSNSKDEHAFYFLAAILSKYPNAFKNGDQAAQFAFKLLIPVLNKGYSDGEIIKGLRTKNIQNNGYVEKVFYSVCRMVISIKDGRTAEQKLAKLLAALCFNYRDIPILRQLIIVLATEFVTGHFLSLDAVNGFTTKITEQSVEAIYSALQPC